MKRIILCSVCGFWAVAASALPLAAQAAPARYPTMAPVARYLMPSRSAEIALARSAAPPSISAAAEVMVLGPHGYVVAVPGANHFVCLVERSWDAAVGDPNFWNFNIRGPDCFNAVAARTYFPILLLKTQLALAGKTQAQIAAGVEAAFRQQKLPAMEPGGICYMLSKQGYLDDQARNWHPHLMLPVPLGAAKAWGANLAGSPVLASDDAADRLTLVLIPVAHWSDGSPDGAAR